MNVWHISIALTSIYPFECVGRVRKPSTRTPRPLCKGHPISGTTLQ